MEHIKDCNTDFAFLSETWLKSGKNDVTAEVKSHNYLIHHNIRDITNGKKRGGGVAILYLAHYNLKKLNTPSYNSFEHIACFLVLPSLRKLTMVSFYRLQHIPVKHFFEEFTELLETLVISNSTLIIGGDVNLHLDNLSSPDTEEFISLLESFDLCQLVSGVTQKKGHQLEVLITNEPSKFSKTSVDDVCLSDHYRISSTLQQPEKIPHKYKTIQYRDIKSMDKNGFAHMITSQIESENVFNITSFSNCIASYNRILKSSLDNFAPLKEKVVKDVPGSTWFDEEYRELRKKRRNAEKLWRKTGLDVHKSVFINLRNETTSLAFNKKRTKMREKINNAANNQKSLYSTLTELTGQNETAKYPSSSCQENANDFAHYFVNKVTNIRANFIPNSDSTSSTSAVFMPTNPLGTTSYLDSFELCTLTEIADIIKQYGLKCSFVDPTPASVLKDNIVTFLPLWTYMVNLSLSTGSIDGLLKQADVTPLLKAFGLDHLKHDNFRPVSHLQFVSKLIERVVSKRLKSHMQINNLETDNQYGYKKGHSTETILIKITNDILVASDKKTASVLLLLDLSAAFDTVDIDQLLNILSSDIGIKGTALDWFRSFLKKRTMRVKVNDAFSEVFELEFGVPQGSVLGPILFNIYIRSIYKHIELTGFTIKGFADDHQIYVSFAPDFQLHFLTHKIKTVMDLIEKWMNNFFLKINQDKTQIIVFGPESIRRMISIKGVFIENDKTCVRFRNVVKNLGVFLDAGMTFSEQINKTVSSSFSSIRTISRIKSFLTTKEKCTLLTSLVLSKIDYCNSLYYGVNSSLLNKLQVVQNSAARLVFNKRKYDHSSSLLYELHWLPVKDRIAYKINLLVHKALYQPSPTDIQGLIEIHSTRTFNLTSFYRSNSAHGDRTFVVYAPKLWNTLPLHLKAETSLDIFKSNLKTFFFQHGYI